MDIKGHRVERVWVEHASDIEDEYYASFTLDRAAKMHLLMLSAKGGVDIEEVAATAPDAIVKLHINPVDGLSADAARHAAVEAGIPDKAIEGVANILVLLYECFTSGDCDLAEINPLILKPTPDGDRCRARPRRQGQPRRERRVPPSRVGGVRRDPGARRPRADGQGEGPPVHRPRRLGRHHRQRRRAGDERRSTWSTRSAAAAPNFLDIGGGANADVMAAALDVINHDDNVRSIFINIFGGITRGEEVANGIVEAARRVELRAPIVIRLDGTNAEEGRRILAESGIPPDRLISQPTMLDAARAAVALAQRTGS